MIGPMKPKPETQNRSANEWEQKGTLIWSGK